MPNANNDGSTDVSNDEKARAANLPDGSASEADDKQRGEDTASGGGAEAEPTPDKSDVPPENPSGG